MYMKKINENKYIIFFGIKLRPFLISFLNLNHIKAGAILRKGKEFIFYPYFDIYMSLEEITFIKNKIEELSK